MAPRPRGSQDYSVQATEAQEELRTSHSWLLVVEIGYRVDSSSLCCVYNILSYVFLCLLPALRAPTASGSANVRVPVLHCLNN